MTDRVRGVERIVCALLLASAAIGAMTAAAPLPTAALQQQPADTRASFDFNEVQVIGNTILSEREIDDAIYPFLGPNRTATQVEQARAALEDAFGKRGFPTASATLPPQTVRDGVVVIKVTERAVGRLRVVGAQYVAPRAIRDAAPSLAEGTVPDMNAVQADIVGLNALPERLDTRNPTSKLMLTILAGVATWEREIMLERQREGIAKAQAEGKYKGRPATIDPAEVTRLSASMGPAAIAKHLGIARSTVYRLLG